MILAVLLDAILNLKFIKMIINYFINNDFVIYSMFAGTVGFIGYKFFSSYLNSFYVDKGTQTSA
jgi:hypothetical protein